MRQSTVYTCFSYSSVFSKLPMRQSTVQELKQKIDAFSKLPMRQSTLPFPLIMRRSISKLPMRQSTAEESERASAPSRETHLHLFYPKFQQGARKADRIGFSCIGQKFWSKFRHRCTIAQAIGAQCSGLLYLTGCLLDEEGKGLRSR